MKGAQPCEACSSCVSSHFLVSNQPITGSVLLPLENQIVPLYYENGIAEVSGGWVHKVKTSIATLAPVFSTRRMVKQYVEEMYLDHQPEL